MVHCYRCLNIIFISVYLCISQVIGSGYFWHLTDTHVDQNYSRTGNVHHLCHEDGNSFPDNGLYGNFRCDSPLFLVNVSVQSMSTIHSNPDFIIWTGDNLPHTHGFDPDWDVTFEAIRNTTVLLTTTFPNTTILPSIGNHDTFPPNLLHPEGPVYKAYLEKGGWRELLSDEAASTFLNGGFFSQVVKPGLRIVSLNTILWYSTNTFTVTENDPANQIQWLDNILKKSAAAAEKVYIIGHVPPGFYNRVNRGTKSTPTFHPSHLEAVLEIFNKYAETIIGQFYGHLHMDMFQLFQYNTGTFKGSSFLAPSVTPWYFPAKDDLYLPVNPSIRLFKFSLTDFAVMDYDQFYLNLTKANSMKRTNLEKRTLFERLYRFTEAYDVPDVSIDSLVQVYEMLKSSHELFDKFFLFLTAGKKYAVCDSFCKVAQLCSISCSSSSEYDLCMKQVTLEDHDKDKKLKGSGNTSQADISLYAFVGLLVVLIVISIFAAVMYKKFQSSKRRDRYEPFTQM